MKERKPGSLMQKLLCVSLVGMWGQGTEATASPQPLKDATFKTLPVSDVMFTEDVLWEKPARSRMECSVMCRGDAQCLMFTFRPATDGPAGSCRSHVKRHILQGNNETVSGARSFSLVKEIWIQKNCTNSSDCRELEPMAACFSGQCLCDGGLFFDHTDNACVKSCERGLKDAYLEYRDMDFNGHDHGSLFGEDIDRCLNWCSADPQCLLFVLFEGFCWFKAATAQDFPEDFRAATGSILYQKTCR